MTAAGTTHIAWKNDMSNAIAVTNLIAQRNQARIDGVVAAGGDTSQLTGLLGTRVESLRQAASVGQQIVDAADDVHIDIGRALAKAQGWAADEKTFHTDAG